MKGTINTVLKAVAVAMGIAVIVLSILNSLSPTNGMLLLGFGVALLGISSLQK
jgi:hypothetical protein